MLSREQGEDPRQRFVHLVPRVPAVGDALSHGRPLVSVRRAALSAQVRVENTREQRVARHRQSSAPAKRLTKVSEMTLSGTLSRNPVDQSINQHVTAITSCVQNYVDVAYESNGEWTLLGKV